MRRRPAAEIAVLTAIDAVVLVALRPQLGSLERHLAAPRTWVARIGPDQAVATLAAALVWVVAAWLAVGLLATAAGRLPGLAGRTSARLSRALLPRTVHRLIAGSAGLGVLLAPVAAVAKAGPVGSTAGRPALASLVGRPPLASLVGRPAVASAVGRPTVASASSPLPVPSWPVDPPGRPTTPPPTTAARLGGGPAAARLGGGPARGRFGRGSAHGRLGVELASGPELAGGSARPTDHSAADNRRLSSTESVRCRAAVVHRLVGRGVVRRGFDSVLVADLDAVVVACADLAVHRSGVGHALHCDKTERCAEPAGGLAQP